MCKWEIYIYIYIYIYIICVCGKESERKRKKETVVLVRTECVQALFIDYTFIFSHYLRILCADLTQETLQIVRIYSACGFVEYKDGIILS